MSTMTPAQLTTWIADLRSRLERGELSAIGRLQVQLWLTVTDVERYVRDLLREVDYWRTLPVEERRGSAPTGDLLPTAVVTSRANCARLVRDRPGKQRFKNADQCSRRTQRTSAPPVSRTSPTKTTWIIATGMSPVLGSRDGTCAGATGAAGAAGAGAAGARAGAAAGAGAGAAAGAGAGAAAATVL